MVLLWSSAITGKIYLAAIIGCGRIGSLLEDDPLREKPCTHAGALSSHPRVSLIAGCDIDDKRLDLFLNRWKIKKGFHNYRNLFVHDKIDILAIATDIKNHHEIVIEAAKSRIPVILCEKPIGLSLKKAHEMIKICQENGSLLVINHERRFSSDYRFVKKLIQQGKLGDIVSIRGNILTASPKDGTSFEEEGGGPLLHDGTHLIDIIRFLTDSEVAWVSADFVTRSNIQVEETLVGMIQLTSGAYVLLEAGGKRDYFSFELDIHGTTGRIIIGNGILKWYHAQKSRHYTGFKDLVEKAVPQFPYQAQFLTEIDEIVQYLDHGIIPESSGEDAYRALETIFALYQSAVEGNKIYLPMAISDENPLKEFFTP